jgi:hypothetical protein
MMREDKLHWHTLFREHIYIRAVTHGIVVTSQRKRIIGHGEAPGELELGRGLGSLHSSGTLW